MKTTDKNRIVGAVLCGAAIAAAPQSGAEKLYGEDGISMGNTGYIYSMPDFPLKDWGATWADGVSYAPSAGVLMGLKSDGSAITNHVELFPFVGQSIEIVSTNGSTVVGINSDGLQLWDAYAGQYVPLSVSNGQFQVSGTGSSVSWSDITGIPAGFADGVDDNSDTDTVLSEEEVDAMVADNGYLLTNGTAAMGADLNMGGNSITNVGTIWLVDSETGEAVELSYSNSTLTVDGVAVSTSSSSESGVSSGYTGLTGEEVEGVGLKVYENGLFMGFWSGEPTWSGLSSVLVTNLTDLSLYITDSSSSNDVIEYAVASGSEYASIADTIASYSGWTAGDDEDKTVIFKARHPDATVNGYGYVSGSWVSNSVTVSKLSQGTPSFDAPSAAYAGSTNAMVVSGLIGPNPIEYAITSDSEGIAAINGSDVVFSGWTAGDDDDKTVELTAWKDPTTLYKASGSNSISVVVSKTEQSGVPELSMGTNALVTAGETNYIMYIVGGGNDTFDFTVSGSDVNAYTLALTGDGAVDPETGDADTDFSYIAPVGIDSDDNYSITLSASSCSDIYKTAVSEDLSVDVRYTGYLTDEDTDTLTTESGDALVYLY